MKYHISPKTDSPKPCSTGPENCPLKTEHFSSKDSAADFLEKRAAKNNKTFKVYKKTSNTSTSETLFVENFVDYFNENKNLFSNFDSIENSQRQKFLRNKDESNLLRISEKLKMEILKKTGDPETKISSSRDNKTGSDLDIIGKNISIELKLGMATELNVGHKSALSGTLFPEIIGDFPTTEDTKKWKKETKKIYEDSLTSGKSEKHAISAANSYAFEQKSKKLFSAYKKLKKYENRKINLNGQKLLKAYLNGITSYDEIQSDSSRIVHRFDLRNSGEWKYVEKEKIDGDLYFSKIDFTEDGRLNIFIKNAENENILKFTHHYKNNYKIRDEDGNVLLKVQAKCGLGSQSYNGWVLR